MGLISNINVNDYIIEGEIVAGDILPKFKTYEDKILDYLSKHSDSEVINKIKNLEQLNIYDMKELERIFCEELGTKEDYETYNKQKKNFAVLTRSLVGLNQEAVEVSTTLTVYNSVDKTYFKQATSRLNDLFNQEYTNAHKNIALPSKVENKEEEKPVKMIEDDDQLQIEMLEKLLKEKRLKMQKQKEEAEM